MDWILEHLKIVLFVASALAYWISQRRAERPPGTPGAPPSGSEPQGNEDDSEERIRRVQEEIRRKILERASGGPPAAPAPLPRPSPPPRLQPTPPVPVEVPRSSPHMSAHDVNVLERQRSIAEELRLLEARSARTRSTAENVVESGRLRSEAGWKAPETRLAADLRDPGSLRRAIIMREVLGPPVGLR